MPVPYHEIKINNIIHVFFEISRFEFDVEVITNIRKWNTWAIILKVLFIFLVLIVCPDDFCKALGLKGNSRR